MLKHFILLFEKGIKRLTAQSPKKMDLLTLISQPRRELPSARAMPEMATQVHLEMKKTQKKMFLSFNVQSLSNKYEKQKTQLIFLITLQNQDFLSHVSQFIQREDIPKIKKRKDIPTLEKRCVHLPRPLETIPVFILHDMIS